MFKANIVSEISNSLVKEHIFIGNLIFSPTTFVCILFSPVFVIQHLLLYFSLPYTRYFFFFFFLATPGYIKCIEFLWNVISRRNIYVCIYIVTYLKIIGPSWVYTCIFPVVILFVSVFPSDLSLFHHPLYCLCPVP